jgi:hypothetical protein
LDFLNYDNMMDGTRELLTTDKWSMTFDRFPAAVYNPGQQALNFRLKAVYGLGADVFEIQPPIGGVFVRGFEIPVQPGQAIMRNRAVQLALVDYEDQSIYAFITDWKAKCCNPINQWSFPADQVRADLTFTRLNSQNQPVRRYKMKNAIIAQGEYPDQFLSERGLVGDNTVISLYGMVFPPELLNTGN